MDILPESYFTETAPRDRALTFVDKQLAYLSDSAYKVTGLVDDELPEKGFPEDLAQGLSGWIDLKRKMGEEVQILDVGAGEGNLARDLSLQDGVEVVSVDAYPVQIDGNSPVIEHDVNKPLPFADKSFGFVVCSFVLPYLEDPIRTINEMIRTAKAGGYILLNGARGVRLEREVDYFFSSNNPVKDSELIVYNNERFSGGDWVLIQVNNPDFKFDYSLDMSRSHTIRNRGDEKMYVPISTGYEIRHESRDIRDLATFVYTKNEDKPI